MDINQTILELEALEVYFEEGRRRCYALRKGLEQQVASTSSPQEVPEDKAKLIAILNKRKARFGKPAQKKIA